MKKVPDLTKYKVNKVRGGGDLIINEATDPAFNGEDKMAVVTTITAPRPPMGMPNGPGAGGKRKGHRRSTKTFPRGILRKTAKIHPTRNPTKAPPTSATRKRSVKLMMESGVEKARKTAKAKAAHMDIALIRKKLVEKKIIGGDSKKNIPPTVLRTLYADSVGAGLLS
jgi:hypothetical protein